MAGEKRGLSLPWERRGAWFRGLVAGPRWKVALLAIGVVAIVVVLFQAADRHGRYRTTRAAIAEVQRAISEFRHDLGRCPRSTVELLHPPRSGTRYLRDMPDDGWGQQLFVRCPARHDEFSAEVVSAGPSGSFFVDDNVR
ncbi:MAG: type II secretion system protein GspG [Myxococcota bacterium]